MNKYFKNIINFIKNHKKMAIGVLVALATTLIVFKVAGPKEEKFKTSQIEKGELSLIVSASGKTRAQNQVDLKFQTSGQLAWVGVKEGETVKKWQAIASLDKRELEKDLKKKLLAYMNERWDFEQSQDDYNVEGKPLDKVILSDAEQRILEKAQFDLDNTVLDVEIKDLANRLATLVSPIEGILAYTNSPIAGVNILSTTAVFTVADPAVMFFMADLDEGDISLVSEGQKVKITLDAYEEIFEGEVKKIDFTAVMTKGGGTAFPMEISLPENKNLRFRIGMNGDADIIIQKKENVLSVPSSALWQKDGKYYVWLVTGNKARKQAVTIGMEAEENTEVIEGLKEGDEVAVEKVAKIKEGQKLK